MNKSNTGVANKVVNLMSSLTTATEAASEIAQNTNTVEKMVDSITKKATEAFIALEKCEEREVDSRDFREALRDTQRSGTGLKFCCSKLATDWNSFDEYVRALFIPDSKMSQDKVRDCILKLQSMQQSAVNCGKCYYEFAEKLQTAIDAGVALDERCKAKKHKIELEAERTRQVGKRATMAFGIASIAFGFVTIATGGLALPAAATVATGVSAIGAGAITYDRAAKLDKLAEKFNELLTSLKSALDDLDSVGNLIEGLIVVTTEMARNMETALNIFKEHERLIKDAETAKLHAEEMVLKNRILELDKEIANERNTKLEEKIRRLEKSKKCRLM